MRKTTLFVLCFLYSPLAFADRVSGLEDQVATLQEQVLMLQRQVQHLMAQKDEPPIRELAQRDEQPIMESHKTINIDTENHKQESRIRFKVKPGYAFLFRDEEIAGGGANQSQRLRTGGFATSSELDFRLNPKFTLNLTYDGLFRDSLNYDELRESGPTVPFPNKDIRDQIRLHTGSTNIRYNVFSSERASLDFSLGYELLGEQFHARRPLGAPGEGTEYTRHNLFGHGPRSGLVANFKPGERLGFTAEAFYTAFLRMTADNEQSREDLVTEGYAFRFDLGASYKLTKRLNVGAGYRGYLLFVDKPENTRNILTSDVITMNKSETRVDHLYGYFGINF